MSNALFEALYFGRVSVWNRTTTRTAKQVEVDEQIEQKKYRLLANLPKEDRAHLEELESLYIQAGEEEEIDSFSHGFTLGALLILAIFENKDMVFDT